MSKDQSRADLKKINTYGDSGFQIETANSPKFASRVKVSEELKALGLIENRFSFPLAIIILLVLGLVLGGLYGTFQSSNFEASASEIDLYRSELSKPLEISDLR